MELVWGDGDATGLGPNVYTQCIPLCELGPDVNTHATSDVTLVQDDGPQPRAHKVILDLQMLT